MAQNLGMVAAVAKSMVMRYQKPQIRSSKKVALGDSITFGNEANVRQYPTWLSWATNSMVINAGVNGNRLDQMLARLDIDVIAHRPGSCIICGGTNDGNSGRPLQAVAADFKAITAKLVANNIDPIICSVLPRDDNLAIMPFIYRLNEWLQTFCLQQGFIFIDLFSVFADEKGLPKPGYLLTDKLHPTQLGMRVIAETIAAHLPTTKLLPVVAKGDTSTTVPNPLFATGTHEVAAGWGKYGSAGNLLKFNRADGWQTVEKDIGNALQTGGFQVKLPSSLVENRSYRVEMDMDFRSNLDSVCTSYFQFKSAAGVVLNGAVYLLRSPTLRRIDRLRVTADIAVPAGTVSTEWITFGQSVDSFTLRIANPRIVENL
ncbi:GDSL-type esterase/lipase family protein [Paenibacillus agilis]|uniref:SGNH hydrolase-type esterase domain-containing protein n=1 Tax=Paenibacillus agilis TaxID=3020863 RepID=A0A559IZL3_9BACL|nr:GDSL-type esterase/lipase family protein [Paenibacillus agilis]TVX93060.1 hypothetical protein FPZ44_08295 [Paenibacillus agilis]